MSETCKSCGKPIQMLKHERTGNPAPIEVDPVENGNIVLNEDGTYRIIKKGEAVEGQRYINHYAACPEARKFREETKAKESEAQQNG